MAVWTASTALYEAHFGSPEAARALLRDAVESGLEQVGWDIMRLVTLAFYTGRRRRSACRRRCGAGVRADGPWEDQFIWSGANGYGHMRLWLGAAAAILGGTVRPTSTSPLPAGSTTTTASGCGRPDRIRLGGVVRRPRRARPSAGARGTRARARTRVRLRPDRGSGRADRGRRSSCRHLM